MPPPGPDVALAVVVSPRGVLLIERADRTPPLAFPGGKIEPGETPLEAASRETLEETGVRVACSAELASRVHPQTGATIVYTAAIPADDDAQPFADDRAVLGAMWWPIADALVDIGEELHPGVLAHLGSAM